MTLELETLEAGRKKWQRLGFFRGLFVGIIIFGLFLLFYFNRGLDVSEPHIARYEINGIITDNIERDKHFEGFISDGNIKALIIRINSPGGTTVGSEAIFESIRQVAKVKPVIAVMGEIAASGGYIAALASDYIIARKNSLTGSIGVIIQYPNFSKLVEQVGVSVQTISSGEEKGGQSMFLPIELRKRENEIELVEAAFNWFINLVKTRRRLEDDTMAMVSSGKLFSGQVALEIGLIDAIGAENEAVRYLTSLDVKYNNLQIVDKKMNTDFQPWWFKFLPIGEVNSLIAVLTSFQGPTLHSMVR